MVKEYITKCTDRPWVRRFALAVCVFFIVEHHTETKTDAAYNRKVQRDYGVRLSALETKMSSRLSVIETKVSSRLSVLETKINSGGDGLNQNLEAVTAAISLLQQKLELAINGREQLSFQLIQAAKQTNKNK